MLNHFSFTITYFEKSTVVSNTYETIILQEQIIVINKVGFHFSFFVDIIEHAAKSKNTKNLR